jgi:hypothetical protein
MKMKRNDPSIARMFSASRRTAKLITCDAPQKIVEITPAAPQMNYR